MHFGQRHVRTDAQKGKMADGEAVINLKKLKVAELKKELADRGLSTKGNKSDLQERLEKCLADQGMVVSQDESDDIVDENDPDDDLDNDADDLDDVDVGDVSEHLEAEDLDTKDTEEDKEVTQEVTADEKKTQKVISVERVPITPPGKVAGQVTLTDAEKKSKRLERFGMSPPVTDVEKKQARAQRFGFSSPASNGTAKSSPIVGGKEVDVDKLKKRAERFGAVSPAITKLEENDKLLKRKQRFGVTITGSPGNISDAKKKRAERFGL